MELAKKTEPAKVVVWGIGEDYDNVYNSIEELKKIKTTLQVWELLYLIKMVKITLLSMKV